MHNFHCQNCTVRTNSIFEGLIDSELKILDEIKICKFYDKGEFLFQEGEDPKGIFCLRAGKIKVSKYGVDGKGQITHLAHAGQTLGHRALFADENYSGSAVALDRVHVCFIPKNSLKEIVNKNPSIVWSVAKLLAKELREAESKITHMAQESVKIRLIEALKTLIETYGYTIDGMTINVPIIRQDLADIVGSTRETVTRNLYALQSENLILLSGKKISILDKSVFNLT